MSSLLRNVDLRYMPFKQIHVSQAQFAFNLLGETEFTKSVVISPISISITLGMALLGAKGKTAEEIQSAVAKDVSLEEIHTHFSSILKFVEINSDVIKMAEKAFCIDKLNILDEYKNEIEQCYNGNFQLISFIKNQEAADEINKFVALSTDNKIQNIVEPEMFDEFTAMVLINALKFDAKWEEDFELLPSKQPFYSSADSLIKASIEVSMMKKEVCCRYFKNEKYEMVELPYKDSTFSMFIILPKKGTEISEVLKDINVTEILVLMVRKFFYKGAICIPKFDIDSSFDLSKMLKTLNINEAFDKIKADFSGIGHVSGILPLHISKILQKATINVNETGTTAAAATVEELKYLSSAKPPEPFEFIADHPFIYLIVDKNRNIYFIGTFCEKS